MYKKIVFLLWIVSYYAYAFECSAIERIVSLAPSNTDIVIKLGKGNKLVGVTKQCKLPEGMNIEIIGEFASIHKEKVFSLKPDLVLTSDGVQEPIAESLSKLKLNVKIISTQTIDSILESILNIGSWIDADKQAEVLVRSINDELYVIDQNVKDIAQENRPAVFIEMWNTPLSSAGNGSFIHEMITRAGGRNIAADINQQYPRINPEWVVNQNPDIIIIAYKFMDNEYSWRDKIKKRPGWERVSAVQKGEIYDDVPPEYFLQPGPYVSEGITRFHEIIMRFIKKSNEK